MLGLDNIWRAEHDALSVFIRRLHGFSFMAIVASLDMKAPLWFAAWGAYLIILIFWIKNNRAPMMLLVVGTVLGLASVISSPFFIALLWALPAIALMLHVIKCSLPISSRVN